MATQNIIHAHPRNMNVRDFIKHAVQSQLWLSTTWLVIQPIQIPATEITVSAFNLYIHSPTTSKYRLVTPHYCVYTEGLEFPFCKRHRQEIFYFLSSCGKQVVIGVRVNPGITSVFQGESMIILQGQFSPARCMHNGECKG